MITFPFSVITSVDLREQVMGTTIVIKIELETGNYEYTLDNCPKRSGEFAYSFLKKMMGKILCYHCFKPIKEEFLFCPYCKNRLKNTCSSCGKTLETDWLICPYCGCEK
jgi:RNA polymerase subunit RPABC4/transcription elongation factor Spt4